MSFTVLEGKLRERWFRLKWNRIDPFHKWLPIINPFVSIKISLTNLVLELIIQKNFYSQTSLVGSFKCIQKNFKLAAIYEKGLWPWLVWRRALKINLILFEYLSYLPSQQYNCHIYTFQQKDSHFTIHLHIFLLKRLLQIQLMHTKQCNLQRRLIQFRLAKLVATKAFAASFKWRRRKRRGNWKRRANVRLSMKKDSFLKILLPLTVCIGCQTKKDKKVRGNQWYNHAALAKWLKRLSLSPWFVINHAS